MTYFSPRKRPVDPGSPADHTFVVANVQPPAIRPFACWSYREEGGKEVCPGGQGNYPVADCYRLNYDATHLDTAGIGVYGLNGVCHQSANCFLFSANIVMPFWEIGGGFLTYFFYGAFGSAYRLWRPLIYGQCVDKRGSQGDLPAEGRDRELIDRIVQLRERRTEVGAEDEKEEVVEELRECVEYFTPDVDLPADFSDKQMEFLTEKENIIGPTAADAGRRGGEQAAERLNELGHQFLQALGDGMVSTQDYEKLIGAPPGQMIDLIDPNLAHLVGQQPPDQPD
ncbi:hypothetical protein [Streptomyces fungicidicus]|uniref:Uncharacterized protein n=1 Tax=Streptomyces fungicidicus TaxID=68203 RepID=A0ACC7Y8N9_9ACTN|nr:hypothetical protein [Streptomyces fungicidicus]NUV78321.1 hypothetical protein [Streptomyces fungicidicus]